VLARFPRIATAGNTVVTKGTSAIFAVNSLPKKQKRRENLCAFSRLMFMV
jgi:hypothetical protein